MKKNSVTLKTFPFKKNFQFPEHFFEQLNEFTAGGYVLLYLNQNGNPQVQSHFDNSATSLALTTFGKAYFEDRVDSQRELIRDAFSIKSSEAVTSSEETDQDEESV